MRQIDALLRDYSESHQNKANKYLHAISVPTIYFVSLALVWSIPTPEFLDYFGVTWAHVIVIPALYYYFKLSGPVGAAMTFLSILSFFFIKLLVTMEVSVWQFSLGLFVSMWILQFYGHHIEGKKIGLFKDIQFLYIGPAWWSVHWLKRLNINY